MNNDFDVKEITPLELKKRLDSGEIPTLVDVREYHEAEIADLPDYDQLRIPTGCLLYTSPSPRDKRQSRMPSSA